MKPLSQDEKLKAAFVILPAAMRHPEFWSKVISEQIGEDKTAGMTIQRKLCIAALSMVDEFEDVAKALQAATTQQEDQNQNVQ